MSAALDWTTKDFGSFPLRLQPQLYKPADSFGTDGQVGLIGSPGINPRDKLIGQADSASWIDAANRQGSPNHRIVIWPALVANHGGAERDDFVVGHALSDL